MAQAQDERRKHARFPFLLAVGGAPGSALPEWTENVSAGGVFVRSNRACRLGDDTEVTIALPRALPPLTVAGRIAWVRPRSSWVPPGFGLDAHPAQPLLARIAEICGELEAGVRPVGCQVLVVGAPVDRAAARGRAELITVADAHAAEAVLASAPPDFVVMRLTAPAGECLRQVRELRRCTTRPILCLPSGDDDLALRALHAGADAVLPEGAAMPHLFATLASVKWVAATASR
jgi:Tfp pilus assembly protein PilZ